jgi:hypothetical protein
MDRHVSSIDHFDVLVRVVLAKLGHVTVHSGLLLLD